MKGFKIDAVNEKITEIELSGRLQELQEVVEGPIELAHSILQKRNKSYENVFYAHGEARLNLTGKFLVPGVHIKGAIEDFYIGDLVVTGVNLDTGNSIDSDLTLEGLKEIVTFRSLINFGA